MNIAGANQASPTNYFSFTVAPDSGYQTTFESLSFYTGANFANEEYNVRLTYWDGISEAILGDISHTTGGSTNLPVVFFSMDFADFTSTATSEFRIYGYDMSSSNGGIRLDDIVLNGTTTAIPEPTTTVFLGLSAIGVFFYRRCQSAK